ncbi:MAG TPA: aspartate aminotransferase family protein [Thermoplasmata archaeon]|nr:aspartate aminotransferase family protein [Thermoplasmata archaeon]
MGAFDPIAEYRARTRKSAAWHAEASRHLPGGVTGNVKFYAPYPVYAKRAKGGHLWDLDGNDYVDYMLCFGPMILGHGHPKVLEAIRKQIDRDGTVIFGPPHELEVRMAERLKRIFPFADLVRFTNSGLEATLHALRIARGVKHRVKIAKFEGAYHGSYDEVLVSLTPPVPEAGPADAPKAMSGSLSTTPAELQGTVVLPLNDLDACNRILKAHQGQLAALILEPVQRGFLVAEPEFLKGLRETTKALDMLLIFDEIMSGFRMEKLGAVQTLVGVDPDLMTLGKIIGGGFPCGAFLGSRETMDAVNPVTRPASERVFHGGTFNGHPTVLAAGLATLDVLEEPHTYPYLNRISDQLRDGLNGLFADLRVDAQAIGPGSTFNVVFAKGPMRNYRDAAKADKKKRELFDFGMLARGIHFHPDKPFYTCTAHTPEDVDRTLTAAEDVLRRMQ